MRCRNLVSVLASLLLYAAGALSNSVAQPVTFNDVLENPDDTSLNLQFAKQEIAAGRLQPAATALERLLLNNPNLDSVRFLYGVLLYRMDDLEGALREFNLLEGRGLSSRQEQDRIRYLNRIQHAKSPIRVTGQFAFGGRYDTNPGRVSDRIANAVVGVNILNPIIGMNDAEDIAVFANGFVRVEGDLKNAPGSEWFVQADGNIYDFQDIDRADSNSGSIKAGVSLVNDRLSVTPYAIASRTALQDEEFNRRWGAGAHVSYRASPLLTVFANGEYISEDYLTTSFSVNNNQRDGDLFAGRIGAALRLNESQKLTVSVFAVDKEADTNKGFSYEQAGVSASLVTLLGKGAYVTAAATYSETDYDQPDGLGTSPFNVIRREDERLFIRGTVGAPLQTIVEGIGSPVELPDPFKDVILQFGVSHGSLSSSSSLIDYENLSGDVLFKKKFAF